MNIVQRTISSSLYNTIANIISLVVGFVGSVALTRLLEPEIFGIFLFVTTVVHFSALIPEFGFHSAFLHRTAGDKGIQEEILRVHFTLKLIFSSIWAVLMAIGICIFTPDDVHWAYWIVIAVQFLTKQTDTTNVLLTRMVRFRRLAIMNAIATIASIVVSIILAWRGWGLWALLCGKIINVIIDLLLYFVIRPIWIPRLGWSDELVCYFIGFGSKVFGSTLLLHALDSVDDLWTGVMLGNRALGFYHKAYSFATYPRQLLTMPLSQIVSGIYAHLRDDRRRLSHAFSWVNFIMIRANFLIAALLWLIAPEFIRLALGNKWLPILDAFRLMLIYTMFDPIKTMIGSLLIISGVPNRVTWIRIIQLVIMGIGLFLLGPWLGIAGVALAVDLMLIVGIVMLYMEVRSFVDFSLKRLLVSPTVSMSLGIAVVHGVLFLSDIGGNDWLTGTAKVIIFSLSYIGSLVIMERRQFVDMLKILSQSLRINPV
jgi:O-antigen/teichoic acid export membrane protein